MLCSGHPVIVWAHRALVLYFVCTSVNTAIAQAPTIASPPLTKLAIVGQTVTFNVAATGAPPLTYRWIRNGQVIVGTTGSTLSLPNITLTDRGNYQVTVTNNGGSASSVFHLNVGASDATLVRWNQTSELTLPTGFGALASVVSSSADFGLRTNGTVVFVGGFDISGIASIPTGLTGVVEISTSGSTVLALKDDGTAVSWGNSLQILSRMIPDGLNNVVSIAAGDSFSMALKADGTVQA